MIYDFYLNKINSVLSYNTAYIYYFMSPPQLKNGVRAALYLGLSVCEWVRESVRPKNLVNTIPQKQMKEISPNFGHRCIWLRRYAD